jgi:HAE1 family hydrophobic/amphiphilic exporter-1
VATPLEKNFSTIAGLDSMSSTSSLGRTQITLQFSLSRNVDAAAQDVQAMIARSARDLPPNMPTPPSYRKVNPANNSILLLALTSPTLPLSTVDEFAQTILAQRAAGAAESGNRSRDPWESRKANWAHLLVRLGKPTSCAGGKSVFRATFKGFSR